MTETLCQYCDGVVVDNRCAGCGAPRSWIRPPSVSKGPREQLTQADDLRRANEFEALKHMSPAQRLIWVRKQKRVKEEPLEEATARRVQEVKDRWENQVVDMMPPARRLSHYRMRVHQLKEEQARIDATLDAYVDAVNRPWWQFWK